MPRSMRNNHLRATTPIKSRRRPQATTKTAATRKAKSRSRFSKTAATATATTMSSSPSKWRVPSKLSAWTAWATPWIIIIRLRAWATVRNSMSVFRWLLCAKFLFGVIFFFVWELAFFVCGDVLPLFLGENKRMFSIKKAVWGAWAVWAFVFQLCFSLCGIVFVDFRELSVEQATGQGIRGAMSFYQKVFFCDRKYMFCVFTHESKSPMIDLHAVYIMTLFLPRVFACDIRSCELVMLGDMELRQRVKTKDVDDDDETDSKGTYCACMMLHCACRGKLPICSVTSPPARSQDACPLC